MSDSSDTLSAIILLALYLTSFLAGVIIYMVPSFIAHKRKHPSVLAIAATNILLGWSCLGWLVCFIWALTNNYRRDG